MTDTKLNIAVLGAGRWAELAHIPGWQRDLRCQISAICDPVIERAQDFAKQFGISEATADWQSLIVRPGIDVIDIATPSHTHFELAWAAIEAGKHVLCEKPVAFDFRETRRAAAA